LTKPNLLLLQNVVNTKKISLLVINKWLLFVDKKDVFEQKKSGMGRITTLPPLNHRSTYYRPTFISINKTTVCSYPTLCSFPHIVIKNLRLLV